MFGSGGDSKWKYPVARKDSKTQTSFPHGTIIPNPFEWLENLNSPSTLDFITKQNTLATEYITSCKELNDIRKAIKNVCKIRARKMSCPTESVGKMFFFMTDGDVTQGHDSLYLQESSNSMPQLFVSPKDIPGKPRWMTLYLRMYNVSLDCKTVAYAFSTSSESEWMRIRFKDVRGKTEYPEELKNVCKSDICWTHDNQGILYSCYPTAFQQIHHKIAFHRPGTSQLDDIVLVEFPTNAYVSIQAQISDSGNLLFVYAQENYSGSSSGFHHFFYGDFTPCIETDYEWTPLLYHLFEGEQLDVQYITNDESFTYLRTNIKAPNYRIVRCRLFHEHPLARSFWETMILEDPKRLLDWAKCVNKNFLMVCYLQHGAHFLELHKLNDGTLLHKYSLPMGTITDCYGDRLSNHFYFTFTSFLIPDRVHCITIRQKRSGFCGPVIQRGNKRIDTIFDNRHLEKAWDLSNYCIKQKQCKSSRDRTLIHMFVMHKKGLKMNGNAPCIVYGQGCFGVQVLPSFCISKLMFMKCFDGVIAIVGTRGGGEEGERWYHDGSLLNKQNCYGDLISAVEFLIKSGYTSSSKLILEGELFGGNLAGACLTQRPDLFGAVIIHDGLLDMLRFPRFPQSEKWKSEFGNPDEIEDFRNLIKLSPLHNIPKGDNFPAVMLTVSTTGPSIACPGDSLKFIAQLQHNLLRFGWTPAILKMEYGRWVKCLTETEIKV